MLKIPVWLTVENVNGIVWNVPVFAVSDIMEIWQTN